MRVYLIQHGQARPKEADSDRHLTKEGTRAVERLAEFLRPQGIKVQAIWHSGKTRARETAQIVERAFQPADGVQAQDGMGPTDRVRDMAGRLREADGHLVLVGHLPYLDKLTSLLVTGDENAAVVAFSQGGLVCLERGEDHFRFT